MRTSAAFLIFLFHPDLSCQSGIEPETFQISSSKHILFGSFCVCLCVNILNLICKWFYKKRLTGNPFTSILMLTKLNSLSFSPFFHHETLVHHCFCYKHISYITSRPLLDDLSSLGKKASRGQNSGRFTAFTRLIIKCFHIHLSVASRKLISIRSGTSLLCSDGASVQIVYRPYFPISQGEEEQILHSEINEKGTFLLWNEKWQ